MPTPKDAVDATYPCDFYTPAELLAADRLYTIPEIARLLQELEPEADLDGETEAILIDWAVPWVMVHADDLVVAEPEAEDAPGLYGLRTDAERERFDDGEAAADGS